MNVAFLGLGQMGSVMAKNLISKGWPTTVWNRTASRADPLVELGAETAPTPQQAVQGAEVVITSLMDDHSIRELLHSDEGLLAGLQPGATHLCVTTISPALADELAATHEGHGSRYVSGPVVGRPPQAEAGQLRSFLSGHPEGIPPARQVAETYSASVRVVKGPASAANVAKLCVNYSALSIIEMIGEVYTFAEKSGVEPEVVNEFYQAVFAHPALKEYANMILGRDFHSNVGFTLRGGHKDLNLMLEHADQSEARLEIGQIIADKMSAALDEGLQDHDWSVFTEITRRNALAR
jgi:3-hydroxyisobutyrate dehydrogenase-like beta-hydroxyacid dehydrogenase